MRQALIVTALLSTALAGCLSGDTGDTDDPTAGSFEAKPWFNNWEIIATDLQITVDPEATNADGTQQPFITGEGTITVQNPRPGPLDFMVLNGGFTITELKDADGQDLSITDGNNATMTGAIYSGAVQTLTITYEGHDGDALAPVSDAGDEFGAHYMRMAPYTTSVRNNAEARYTLISPVDWTVLGAADRRNETVDGDQRIVEYFNYEPRIIGYAAEGLLFMEDEVDGVEVKTWHFPSQMDQGEAMHQTAVLLLRNIPDWTGPYPYDHMWTVPHHVSVNAFNTPALSFMGWTFYRPGTGDTPVQFGRDLIPVFGNGQHSMENVLVHESVHNWWGQMVRGNNSSPDADGERDTWMTEGITTYLAETVWFDRMYSEEEGKQAAEHMVRALTQGRTQAGEERSTTEPGGDYYVKGAMSMRALEAYGIATGRPDLTMDILTYAMDKHSRQNGGEGFLDTSEFVLTFDEAAGEDLSWWYDAWHYSGELSDFTIPGIALTTHTINVTVDNLGGAKGAALVEVELSDGQTLRGWTVVDAGSEGFVEISRAGLDGAPVRATVDPLQHIYEMDEQNNVWSLDPSP